ncbi:MAG: PorV/PorQ family protein [Candidatus Marinimicrobia bacterium]|nr:PorV/PorQ family protein [Candidatus Neomarinimicrobiota bacterium]
MQLLKKTLFHLGICLLIPLGNLWAVSEAAAIFLLISPGARAGGMGEAQVAVANDAYASYWNPAGLAFLPGREIALMHVNWLPNLVSDMYYEFIAFRQHVPSLGTLGGHIIYLNLGEQQRTDEQGNPLGTFTSFMFAMTGSYGANISDNAAIGLNVKIMHQKLAELGAGAEKGKGKSTDFAFDVGYLHKELWTPRLDIGLTITNIGPKVSFIDEAQADPMPTNFTFGINYKLIDSEFNKFHLVLDIDKMLVASYPDMDWNNDGRIGGFDKDGHSSITNAIYNKKGQQETAHTDPIYIGIFTSWVDDWYLGGDIDKQGKGGSYDKIIGGYTFNSNGDIEKTNVEWGEPGYGKYNDAGELEVGTGKKRSIKNELDEMIFNFGMEYWYSKYFALRAGYYYDKTGKINNPTFGIGLRFSGYGFDAGFTLGEPGHPLTNTMRFSLNMEF